MNRLLPHVGDEVLLSVPQTEQVLARVDAEGLGFFDLSLLEHPRTPQPQLERCGLMIEFINDDGVARMHGRLDVPEYRRGTTLGYAGKHVVRFAHRGSPQLLKRREFVRATVELPLTLTAGEDAEPMTGRAQALDISGGGMLAGGLEAPQLGDTYTFALELAEGEPPVRGRCEVARVVSADRAGLRFLDVERADSVRLMHLAFEMSREQRRRID